MSTSAVSSSILSSPTASSASDISPVVSSATATISTTESSSSTTSSSVIESSPTSSIPFCSSVSSYFAADGLAAATSFCSSFLNVPVQTATVTATTYAATTTETLTVISGTTTLTSTTAMEPEPATTTATEYVTSISRVTTTATVSSPTIISITSCAEPPTTTVFKRLLVTSLPGALDDYMQGDELSSACSCLSIPVSTTTVTVTTALTAQATFTTTMPVSETAVTTTTPSPTRTNTITNTLTVTLVSVVTSTSTVYTSTSYTLAVPTFRITAHYVPDADGSIPRSDQSIYVNYDRVPQLYGLRVNPDDLAYQYRLSSPGETDSLGRPVTAGTLITDIGGAPKYGYSSNNGLRTYPYFGDTVSYYTPLTCSLIFADPAAGFDGTCPLQCQGWAGSVSFAAARYVGGMYAWNLATSGNAKANGYIFIPHAVGSA
ncbi:uncharacterized protein B0I36DRAFT_366219 [Microdochium trichocladiopsis]|uniref:Uncharacterized protein n=1 Tax=Microdochium trichocladiopsis TaxID=1682393 RepID=A0A9P8Y1B7_9PEZI|nr:uncharacterized protein B0I36DRAFT_366219 [Microdochium trichocladiopsis]KAH7026690.1 hypothetical protein B0I36DRAFT_366219 [Microdochium trichocladiopsis]